MSAIKGIPTPDYISRAIAESLRRGRRERIAEELRERCRCRRLFSRLDCVEAQRDELCLMCMAAEELAERAK